MIKMFRLQLMRLALFLLICGITDQVYAQNLQQVVQFAAMDKAASLLATEDSFTDSWSAFDVDSRLRRNNSAKADLMAYLPTQARPWKAEEINAIRSILAESM